MDSAKRECILETAVRCFARLGFKKASVDEIAREAGVAKGTVYLAAENKEDLFYQAVHREIRSWIADVSKLLDPRVPADELLVSSALVGFQFFETHPLVKDLFTGIYDGQLPGWANRFDELRQLGRQFIVELLRLGMKQGAFSKDLDVDETAQVLQDLNLAGYVFHVRSNRPDPDVLQRRLAAGLKLVLDGLRPRT